MKQKIEWTATDTTNAKPIGKGLSVLEFQDNSGEWQYFDILLCPASLNNPQRIVFGGCCNVGFLESGYISQADCETLDETLFELLADLETYYNDGPQYTSRIIHNERM